jgi:hypothetical protein
MKDLPTEEYSPEKAGVGGSIPSLATTFSTIYKRTKTQFHFIPYLLARQV